MAYKMKVYELCRSGADPLVHELKDASIQEDWEGQEEDSFAPDGENQAKYKGFYSGDVHEAWIAVPLNWDKDDLAPAAYAHEEKVDEKLVPKRYHMNGHVEG